MFFSWTEDERLISCIQQLGKKAFGFYSDNFYPNLTAIKFIRTISGSYIIDLTGSDLTLAKSMGTYD